MKGKIFRFIAILSYYIYKYSKTSSHMKLSTYLEFKELQEIKSLIFFSDSNWSNKSFDFKTSDYRNNQLSLYYKKPQSLIENFEKILYNKS